MRAFCPPDKLVPFSPISVNSPFTSTFRSCRNDAKYKAYSNLLFSYGSVKRMFSLTVPLIMQGFCAETGGAATLFMATYLGVPVSTTHTITGAIVGVGSVRRTAAVRWGVAGNIVWAWILTIPCSALIAAGGYWIGRGLF